MICLHFLFIIEADNFILAAKLRNCSVIESSGRRISVWALWFRVQSTQQQSFILTLAETLFEFDRWESYHRVPCLVSMTLFDLILILIQTPHRITKSKFSFENLSIIHPETFLAYLGWDVEPFQDFYQMIMLSNANADAKQCWY